MAHERSIHSAVAIELLFEGEDDQRLIDVVADQADASLPPRPELRSDVIHGGDAALLHLAGDPPVERRRVDDDGKIRLASVGFFNQVPIKSEDLRKTAEDLRDANDREVFGFDHGVKPSGAHAIPADPE